MSCCAVLRSAVDNILVKLAAEGVPFVRLGREQTVHPAVRPWLPGGEQHPERTVAALRRLGETVPVVRVVRAGVGLLKLRAAGLVAVLEAVAAAGLAGCT